MDGPCPVIAAGDLNAAPDSVVLRSLRDLLTDAWIAGHGDPTAVTLPSSHPSAPLEAGPELVDQRIDHIFFRPGQPGMRIIVESASLAGAPVAASTLLIIKLWFVIFAGLRLDHGTGPRLAGVGQHLPDRGGEPRRVVQEAGVTTGKHSGRRPELLGKCFGRT